MREQRAYFCGAVLGILIFLAVAGSTIFIGAQVVFLGITLFLASSTGFALTTITPPGSPRPTPRPFVTGVCAGYLILSILIMGLAY